MSINIEVEGGTSVKLLTAGKYCDKDIVVTANGGSGGSPTLGKFYVDCSHATGSYPDGNHPGYTGLFEIGMTFQEWYDSQYNVISSQYVDGTWVDATASYMFWVEPDYVLQDGDSFYCEGW